LIIFVNNFIIKVMNEEWDLERIDDYMYKREEYNIMIII